CAAPPRPSPPARPAGWGRHHGVDLQLIAAFTAGILGGSATSAQGKHHSNTNKGGGVSARPLPMPINPALLKHADQRRQHLENRIADTITRFAGSMLFVYLHIFWFAAWILLGVEHYPYGLLTMIVSLEAIFLSTFVLISQNRADAKRQLLADHQWRTVQEGERQNGELLKLANRQGGHA